MLHCVQYSTDNGKSQTCVRGSNPDFPSLRFAGYDIDTDYVEINRERIYNEQSTP